MTYKRENVSPSQRKYALDLLKETGMQGCKPVETPKIPNQKYSSNINFKSMDPTRYRSLVGKLLYFTIIRPDISYSVGLVSQFRQKP